MHSGYFSLYYYFKLMLAGEAVGKAIVNIYGLERRKRIKLGPVGHTAGTRKAKHGKSREVGQAVCRVNGTAHEFKFGYRALAVK